MFKRTITYVDKSGDKCTQTMSTKAIQNLVVAVKQNPKKCNGKFLANDIGLGGATMRVACLHGVAKVVGSIKNKLILPYGEGVIEVETKIYKLCMKPDKVVAELLPLIIDELNHKASLYGQRAHRHRQEVSFHEDMACIYAEKERKAESILYILDK